MLDTPVLLLIFNRPDTTVQVFEAIRQAKPKQLFIAADGPRKDRLEDIEKCRKAREIVSLIDWNCEVKTLFREHNLGCKYAVSSAIDWFFENVEEGIILEDDTLPDLSFFSFCQELLAYYRNNERIMHIGGNNSIYKSTKNLKYSYFISNYSLIWGWATWRRAWKNYDVSLNQFDLLRDTAFICKTVKKKSICRYWLQSFDDVKKNKIDTWDIQWIYALWKRNGLSVIAANNLVTNLGFSDNALHTRQIGSPLASLPIQSINDIIYPPSNKISPNQKLELKLFYSQFNIPTTIPNKIRNIAYLIVPAGLYSKVKTVWYTLRGER